MARQAATLPIFHWEAMRLKLYWAYEGTPVVSRSSGTVDSQTAWLLRRGAVRLQWRDQEIELTEGRWLILGRGRGDHEFSGDSRLLSICFRAEWFTGQAFFDDSSPIILEASAARRLEQTADQLVRAAGRVAPGAKNLLPYQEVPFSPFLGLQKSYAGWLEALAGQLQKAGVGVQLSRPTDERVLRAVQLLDEWPLRHPFSECAVAEAVGVSRVHFSRMFVGELGLSAKAYYDRRRLRAARERLTADDMPVKTIAYQLGFHDAAHFSNWFRKHAGTSPSRYRKGRTTSWNLA